MATKNTEASLRFRPEGGKETEKEMNGLMTTENKETTEPTKGISVSCMECGETTFNIYSKLCNICYKYRNDLL